MKIARVMAAAMLTVRSGFALHLAQSQLPGIGRTELPWQETAAAAFFVAEALGAPLRETVTVAADKPIPNLPGKRLISLIVDYPPGASSASHRHARSAFIYAYVLSGDIKPSR